MGGVRARDGRPPAATDGGRALAETEACVEAWTAGEDLLEHLAVLYAIEASQPEVSRTKIEGLTAHYGYTEEGPAVEYFRLHELRDPEHARQARELIAELMAGVDDPEEKADGWCCARARRCAGTGGCSTGSKRKRGGSARLSEAAVAPRPGQATGETARADRRHANRTAATEVARLRLETPGRMGMLMRASARAVSSRLRP